MIRVNVTLADEVIRIVGTDLVGPSGGAGAAGPAGPAGPTGPAGTTGLTVDGNISTRAAGANSEITRAALAADPAFSSRYATQFASQAVYLDAYNQFFAGPWVVGQGNTATTLTAQATAGATTLAVTSGASFTNGSIIVTDAGSAIQKQYRVTAGGGTATLTVTPAVVTTLANGSTITPLWTDSKHLTLAGFQAFYYWVLHTQTAGANNFVLPTGGRPIVLLANSWGITNGATAAAAQVAAMFPTATFTNASVGGNTSAMLLARFDTDVPSNAAYVIINEPGINDATTGVTLKLSLANLAALVAKTRALGAIPIIVGAIPSSDNPGPAAELSRAMLATNSGPQFYPTSIADVLAVLRLDRVTTNVTFGLGNQESSLLTGVQNTAVGSQAQQALTGGNFNTAMGERSQLALTTGTSNSGFGAHTQMALTTGARNNALGTNAQLAMTTGSDNTAVGDTTQTTLTTGTGNTALGSSAQAALTGTSNTGIGYNAQKVMGAANFNTAVGAEAQSLMTTGGSNIAVGHSAQRAPAGLTANATTTASKQTSIGFSTGQGSASQSDDITTIGYQALADGTGATSLGSGANAAFAGSVALGMSTVTTVAQQVAFGLRHLELVEITAPAAGATNSARIYAVDNGAGKTQLMVRFATGAVQQLAIEP